MKRKPALKPVCFDAGGKPEKEKLKEKKRSGGPRQWLNGRREGEEKNVSRQPRKRTRKGKKMNASLSSLYDG